MQNKSRRRGCKPRLPVAAEARKRGCKPRLPVAAWDP